MLNLQQVHRPRSRDEALKLLEEPGAVFLAGGTELMASRRRDVQAVIDLSGLGLAFIENQAEGVSIGAMTRIAEIEGSQMLEDAANGIVAQAARRTKTSVLRNQATVGGTLIAEPNGILATALAALDARIMLESANAGNSDDGLPLADFLADRTRWLTGSLLTEVRIPAGSLERRAGLESVARTPLDRPIVSVGVSIGLKEGRIAWAAIALGGVAEAVLRARAAEGRLAGQKPGSELFEQIARESATGLSPLSDFRGSAEYRAEMVRVLTVRALGEILPLK